MMFDQEAWDELVGEVRDSGWFPLRDEHCPVLLAADAIIKRTAGAGVMAKAMVDIQDNMIQGRSSWCVDPLEFARALSAWLRDAK